MCRTSMYTMCLSHTLYRRQLFFAFRKTTGKIENAIFEIPSRNNLQINHIQTPKLLYLTMTPPFGRKAAHKKKYKLY